MVIRGPGGRAHAWPPTTSSPGFLETALAPDELLTEVPHPEGHRRRLVVPEVQPPGPGLGHRRRRRRPQRPHRHRPGEHGLHARSGPRPPSRRWPAGPRPRTPPRSPPRAPTRPPTSTAPSSTASTSPACSSAGPRRGDHVVPATGVGEFPSHSHAPSGRVIRQQCERSTNASRTTVRREQDERGGQAWGSLLALIDGTQGLEYFEEVFTNDAMPLLRDRGVIVEPAASETTGQPALDPSTPTRTRASWWMRWLPSSAGTCSSLISFRHCQTLAHRSCSCDMPHNSTAITNRRYDTCANGHNIERNHRVSACPVCGQSL